ncbi:MAG: bifunctional UDP-N-acetylglucosamine diphosphorylase/glucosamine-1-phosphate N-acetyltransferase GlmU [Gammaproteobacteria bacterium]|nr:bifunctional UDP-N-acetylglucosamine diphosphorylase/glucosamine-1-phosphate N-acetyltransferase GlmU [Gammaproteobacteria bacterium]
MTIEIVILAGGSGKRMLSGRPKVLHTLGGRPLLHHIIESSATIRPEKINIVVGSKTKDSIVEEVSKYPLNMTNPNTKIAWITQPLPEGTGQAACLGIENIPDDTTVIVLNGDMPLIKPDTIAQTAEVSDNLNMVTCNIDNPKSYGRIQRNKNNKITGVIEDLDATNKQKNILEVNANCFGAKAAWLKKWLSNLTAENAMKEYYLPDIVAMAAADGHEIQSIQPTESQEILGANNQVELANIERIYQIRVATQLMREGVNIMDPTRFDMRGILKHGLDCRIDINVILEGKVRIGQNVTIGANTIIRNSVIGNNTVILENSMIENSMVGSHCTIGPYARVRPISLIGDHAKIGNFVEVKESLIDRETKASHLSYIGNARIGRNVNIGAGVITANYDGSGKHKTTVQDNVFIGCDSQLVAPLNIGEGATIGAGSSITRDIDSGTLVLTRAQRTTFPNWQRGKERKT